MAKNTQRGTIGVQLKTTISKDGRFLVEMPMVLALTSDQLF